MIVSESRPRTLGWFHAGPLLYGDWGTSRLYVLGLAFFFTGSESVFFLLAIGLLMALVSWAYTRICGLFPDGGGVYSAARPIHPVLSVIGATLLLCGYLITAAISVVEAMHYVGVPDGTWLVVISLITLGLIGIVNWFGARSAGTLALIIAFAALVLSAIIGVMCLRYIPQGLSHVSLSPASGAWPRWRDFTQIVLALAGIEAVANMTGLMRKPVIGTARKTIWPVLAEVVVLNLLFGLVLTGMAARMTELQDVVSPLREADVATLAPEAARRVEEIKNTAMVVIAETAASDTFGAHIGMIVGRISGVVFALLLLSATNTAVMAMVSVQFAMAQDRELPRPLARLNYSGVPWISLIVACVMSAGVILVERRPERLAELYVLGVCGAITVTVVSSALNKELDLKPLHRMGFRVLALLMLAITVTIIATTYRATIFAGGIVAAVLLSRGAIAHRRRTHPAPLETPAAGWLAEVSREPEIDASKPRIMLAARGRYQSEFAIDLARRRGATLFAMYVRTLRIMDVIPGRVPRIEEDPIAQEVLGTTAVLAREAGVPFVPIYLTSANIAEEILDYTVTFGCDTLIMGKTKRSLFARKLEGDVVTRVAESLPDEVALITRSAETPHKA
ncbi:MAG: amino acid permease [Phycisphaeraceae bacterium]|nr:amino acid permease [Phycisphaeraceae bacterium]